MPLALVHPYKQFYKTFNSCLSADCIKWNMRIKILTYVIRFNRWCWCWRWLWCFWRWFRCLCVWLTIGQLRLHFSHLSCHDNGFTGAPVKLLLQQLNVVLHVTFSSHQLPVYCLLFIDLHIKSSWLFRLNRLGVRWLWIWRWVFDSVIVTRPLA